MNKPDVELNRKELCLSMCHTFGLKISTFFNVYYYCPIPPN